MPALDTYHDVVVRALEKDGWRVTHDPYALEAGGRSVFIDLGAERLVAAERGSERIAVEIKSFVGRSPVFDFELALGQYVLYRTLINRIDPGRKLVLAVPDDVYRDFLQEPIAQPAIDDLAVTILAFDVATESVTLWNE